MVAAGPRPPMSMGGSNGGDEPLKINLGSGMMGEFLKRSSFYDIIVAIIPQLFMILF